MMSVCLLVCLSVCLSFQHVSYPKSLNGFDLNFAQRQGPVRGADRPRCPSRGADPPRGLSRGADHPRGPSRGADRPRSPVRGADRPRGPSRRAKNVPRVSLVLINLYLLFINFFNKLQAKK